MHLYIHVQGPDGVHRQSAPRHGQVVRVPPWHQALVHPGLHEGWPGLRRHRVGPHSPRLLHHAGHLARSLHNQHCLYLIDLSIYGELLSFQSCHTWTSHVVARKRGERVKIIVRVDGLVHK